MSCSAIVLHPIMIFQLIGQLSEINFNKSMIYLLTFGNTEERIAQNIALLYYTQQASKQVYFLIAPEINLFACLLNVYSLCLLSF